MQRWPRATEKKCSSYFVVGDHSGTPEGLSKTLTAHQQLQNFRSGSQLSVVQHGVDATNFRESYTKGTKLVSHNGEGWPNIPSDCKIRG